MLIKLVGISRPSTAPPCSTPPNTENDTERDHLLQFEGLHRRLLLHDLRALPTAHRHVPPQSTPSREHQLHVTPALPQLQHTLQNLRYGLLLEIVAPEDLPRGLIRHLLLHIFLVERPVDTHVAAVGPIALRGAVGELLKQLV